MARTVAFARQMDAALRSAVPVSPAAARTPQGERCFSVTFDDALAEIEHTALPVLKARRIPAAVFVPTAFVGRKADWQMPRESRERDCQVMSFAQLRHLDPELIVLGSHTESHRHLSQLSQEELERELRASRLKLEKETGRAVHLLSFPYGDYDARVLAAAQAAGYKRAFSINPSWKTPDEQTFLVGRVKADPADWPIEFFLKIRGAYRWQAGVRRIKAGRMTTDVRREEAVAHQRLFGLAKGRRRRGLPIQAVAAHEEGLTYEE
jgi:peptidoglycan/xylan/chitin deacetylase (PgdA/CDA1 family)